MHEYVPCHMCRGHVYTNSCMAVYVPWPCLHEFVHGSLCAVHALLCVRMHALLCAQVFLPWVFATWKHGK